MRVSIALIALLMGLIGSVVYQTAYIVRFSTNMEDRVNRLEQSRSEFHVRYDAEQGAQDKRLNRLEDLLPKIAVIESTQQAVLKRLDDNAIKLDRLLEGHK